MSGTHFQGYVTAKGGVRVGDKASSTEIIDKDLNVILQADVIKTAVVSLTNAEIKALDTTPKELVAAPGAGKVIEFIGATLFHDYGTNVLTGTHAMTIGLDDGTVAVADTIAHGDFAHKTADHIYSVKAAVAFNDTAANTVNKNLALKSADDFAGNAGADTVWKVHVAYRIIDFA